MILFLWLQSQRWNNDQKCKIYVGFGNVYLCIIICSASLAFTFVFCFYRRWIRLKWGGQMKCRWAGENKPLKKRQTVWCSPPVTFLNCSARLTLDCSQRFKWFSIIQRVRGRELQRFLYCVLRECFKRCCCKLTNSYTLKSTLPWCAPSKYGARACMFSMHMVKNIFI